MSRILVICVRQYNGHELWTALGVIRKRGHSFDLASTAHVIMDEVTFERNRIKLTIDEIGDLTQYDAFMVVSGNMKDTEGYWDDPRVLDIIEKFNADDRPIAAICCSVPTVRYAAKGKKVSFFPLVRSRQRLGDAGAILQTVALTRDANLVTAEHQMASEMWAEEFCNLIEGLPTQYNLTDSGYVPRGRPRKPVPEVERLRIGRERARLREQGASEEVDANQEVQ